MNDYVEISAKTVEEAVALALDELGAESEEDVEIEILEEGSKGLFGIGSKDARVRVSYKSSPSDEAYNFLEHILSLMNMDVEIDKSEEEDTIILRIWGKDSGIIIGRRGETLDALQYLTSLAVNKQSGEYKRIIIDVENYRRKREETLVRLAGRLADRVARYRRSVTLEPMNPYERRIIHASLQEDGRVETHSIGEEPNRKVVITPKYY